MLCMYAYWSNLKSKIFRVPPDALFSFVSVFLISIIFLLFDMFTRRILNVGIGKTTSLAIASFYDYVGDITTKKLYQMNLRP